LLKVSSDHQKRLRSEAGPLAERIYGEKPGVWQRRIERCWHARRIEKKRQKNEESANQQAA